MYQVERGIGRKESRRDAQQKVKSEVRAEDDATRSRTDVESAPLIKRLGTSAESATQDRHSDLLFVQRQSMIRLTRYWTHAQRLHVIVRRLTTMSPGQDYAAAVQALNSLQSNFSAVEAIRKQGSGWNQRALPEMRDWVRRIGYEVGVGDCVVDGNR